MARDGHDSRVMTNYVRVIGTSLLSVCPIRSLIVAARVDLLHGVICCLWVVIGYVSGRFPKIGPGGQDINLRVFQIPFEDWLNGPFWGLLGLAIMDGMG